MLRALLLTRSSNTRRCVWVGSERDGKREQHTFSLSHTMALSCTPTFLTRALALRVLIREFSILFCIFHSDPIRSIPFPFHSIHTPSTSSASLLRHLSIHRETALYSFRTTPRPPITPRSQCSNPYSPTEGREGGLSSSFNCRSWRPRKTRWCGGLGYIKIN